jgi:hypothetical protein
MLLHDFFNVSKLSGRQLVIGSQGNERLQPEFCHPGRAGHMNVRSDFFPAVEIESIGSSFEDGR